jgi:NAD(P)-dependent dehydrogenase (short-subunit alcohol dehydrogenase family)
MGRLDGKVAIVTGAGGGIGRAHAHLLAREGASVVVNDIGLRSKADAAQVAEEIRQNGGTAIECTISATWDGAEGIVAAAFEAYGTVDILVNNAGAGGMNDLWTFTEEQWDRTYSVGCKGYFAMIRAVAPSMCRRGSGAIVNTSSGSGFGHPGAIAHASAREAAIGITRTVAKEIGRFGVRCNAIRPFAIGTSTEDFAVDAEPWLKLMGITMGATPGVDEPVSFDTDDFPPAKVSPFVVWLCSDAAMSPSSRSRSVR